MAQPRSQQDEIADLREALKKKDAELRVAAWGRDASGGRSAAGTGTMDESQRTNRAPIPVASVAPGKPSSPETEAPVEVLDSQVVDLTGEKEAPKEAPDERGAEEAPPGRVKRIIGRTPKRGPVSHVRQSGGRAGRGRAGRI